MAKRKPRTDGHSADEAWAPPAHLGPVAQECWRHSVEQLKAIGLLNSADSAALEMYASAFERYRLAEAKVKEEGEFVVTPNGYPVTAPWVTSLHKNLEVCRRFQMQYGLTPASRAKIAVVKKQGEIPPNWKGLGFGD